MSILYTNYLGRAATILNEYPYVRDTRLGLTYDGPVGSDYLDGGTSFLHTNLFATLPGETPDMALSALTEYVRAKIAGNRDIHNVAHELVHRDESDTITIMITAFAHDELRNRYVPVSKGKIEIHPAG